ncbi:hypothetical protein MA9V1_003 [Chryseobacterium phage MA9V-1]|nr:hypothetical protein MA9V1_003 [Chryseobacterium phage MA9V-1]
MITLELTTENLNGELVTIKDTFNVTEGNIINVGYGFKPRYQDVTAKEPGMPDEKYRLHHSFKPYEGDTIKNQKSGRIFVVGEVTGFLHYEAPLLENGVKVATLQFEEYYKD